MPLVSAGHKTLVDYPDGTSKVITLYVRPAEGQVIAHGWEVTKVAAGEPGDAATQTRRASEGLAAEYYKGRRIRTDDKVEERLKALDDFDEMKATIRDGLATVRVDFNPSVDADRKYDEVQREMTALRSELPAELARFSVEKFSPTNVNVAQVALVSERAPWRELQDLAERLEDRLEAVPGVRGAETWGYPAREVQVQLDLGRIAQLKLPVSQVLGAIASEAANIPAGSVDVGRRRFNVKTDGAYADIDEVRNTVVAGIAGALVRLKDVASVEWGYADPTHEARLNGKRAVWVTATQQEGENILVRAAAFLQFAADTVSEIQQHAAAGRSRDGGDERHAHVPLLKREPRVLSRFRHILGRCRPCEGGANRHERPFAMVHERQPTERPQSLSRE